MADEVDIRLGKIFKVGMIELYMWERLYERMYDFYIKLSGWKLNKNGKWTYCT